MQDYLADIRGHIDRGSVVLFLGAGASAAANGPSGTELATRLKQAFPRADQSLTELLDVCQDILDTPPYDRNQLEERVRADLGHLQPSATHRSLTQYPWAALLTTNYDDLIELSYRTTSPYKVCQPIFAERFQVNVGDRSRVYLFKLMGSMTAPEGHDGQMVLSRADYHRAIARRRKYFELLSDFIKNGTIVFIGYSFRDHLVFDVMDELIDFHGIDRLPWSYALFDEEIQDGRMLANFSRRRIIPVNCSFQSFMSTLGTLPSAIPTNEDRGIVLSLRGRKLTIPETEARQFADDFEIIHDGSIHANQLNKDDFLKGTNRSWGAFREGWDFQREIYADPNFKRTSGKRLIAGCVKDRAFHELGLSDSGANKVLLIRGMAGVGKSMLLRRLAYDIYSSGEAPVILIRNLKVIFDYKLVTSFIENLNDQLNKQLPVGSKSPPLKLAIIMDDAASGIRHVNRLKEYLTSRGRAALIVAAARHNDWDIMWNQYQFNLPPNDVYEIPERLSERERPRLTSHLHNLGYLPDITPYWEEIIAQQLQDSFFACMYTLVDPSKRPLNTIIQSQYHDLSPLTQKAFRYTSVLHQFNLPINIELLVRSLKCSYDAFISDVIQKDAEKILFSEEDSHGNLLFRTHHPIIAKRTVEFFFGDPEQQKDILIEILSDSLLSNQREREIVEKLLVAFVGPNARPQVLRYDQQRQLFRTICERNPTRTLVHHWGILEGDDKHYPDAERLLKQALALPREGLDSFRGESDQNILTSLGNLHSRIGVELIQAGTAHEKEARSHFEEADQLFNESKFGEYPNAYAYHAQAFMWLQRAQVANDRSERVNFAGRALEILTMAKDNLNEGDLQPIYEMETKVWAQLGDQNQVQATVEILRDKFGTARGYFVYAELLREKATSEQSTSQRKRYLDLALKAIDEGLQAFPTDEHCLGLRVSLLNELPGDFTPQDCYAGLQKWKASATTPNVRLMYDLARTAFILGYYDSSRDYFHELETGIGFGHRLRSRPSSPVLDGSGRIRRFQGAVQEIDSAYDASIRCEDLPSLRHTIQFRPVAARFTPSVGDVVTFSIEFSFRGPVATNVTRR